MYHEYYPAFVRVKGKVCVVVGGGKVAERKVTSLLQAGAVLTVISPTLTAQLRRLRDRRVFAHIGREYRRGDLRGAFLVIAATSDENTNRQVSDEAPCLINVVDVPGMANFIVPSIITRGPLTIAVSTSGASPALARSIRQELAGDFGPEFGHFLIFMQRTRKRAMAEIVDPKQRNAFLKAAASPAVLQTLREHGVGRAQSMVLSMLKRSRNSSSARTEPPRSRAKDRCR